MATESEIKYMENHRNILPWITSAIFFFLGKIDFNFLCAIHNVFPCLCLILFFGFFIAKRNKFMKIKNKIKQERKAP